MNAKDFLQQVKKLDKMIENKLAEVQRWKDIANSATSNMSGEKVESSHNPHKIVDAICTYMDLETEIKKDIDALVRIKNDVISVIEQLNATEYDLLHKVYIQHYRLDEAAYMLKNSYSWATTVHGRALKHVQKILDEREKGT